METVEIKGVSKGIDYAVYEMNIKEKILGYAVCFAAVFVAMQIFFRSWLASLLFAAVLGFFGIKIYQEMLRKKRNQLLLLQFRDMLGSLCTSIGSGKNMPDSFLDAHSEMKQQFGENSYIAKELSGILTGLHNNINIEVLLNDFAYRSGQEDILSFAEIFEVANRRGGSIRQIIVETKDLISDKISIEMEIKTMISGKANELNIMILLPLIIVSQLNSMMGSSEGNLFLLIGIKLVAIGMFVGAYCLGRKIIDIKV